MSSSNDKVAEYKKLLIEVREALVVLLTFYEDITDEQAMLTFIADRDKLIELSKNYDIRFVYTIYEKIKDLKL
ncbi:MAG: hypothetical protein ACTSR8_21525 [Promethearchaeota archaeon]